MTTAEKAKAYDEAIKKAESLYKASEPMSGCNVIIETLFPELKEENEDERIRKALITFFSRFPYNNMEDAGINAKDVISWLEKQTEQKPSDKVEPKFKVGDWLIFNERHNGIYQVERIDDYRYYLRHYLGGTMSVHFDNELIRLWTLQDAKSGDVLSNGKMIVIFKHFEEPSYRQHIVAYIGLDRGGDIQITDDTWNLGIDKAKPATKEQRELLFQKMKEAGYTFDFEKKELKKLKEE